jgi:hemophore-related protein
VQDYLGANPSAKADLTGIRQPLVDMKNRCGSAPAPAIP